MERKLLAACWCLLLLLPGVAAAQYVTISGSVTDTDGEALIGANVFIEKLVLGGSTDIDGRYSFEVPSSRVGQSFSLKAGYIGFSPQNQLITIEEGNTTVDFVLDADLFDLDEVVVTGVAEATPQKKLAFTVDRVSKELVEMAPANNPLAGLHGKVAGASVMAASGQPGEGISVRLRGSTSITGSAEPLYIVDGVILGANQVDIDALDIDNIEVVKGAAASSLYGSRAQNGVIQITTKRGGDIPINQTRVTLRNEFGANFMTRNFRANQSHNYRLNAAGTSFLDGDGNEVEYGASAALDAENGVSFFDNPYPGQTYNAFDELFDPGNTYTNSVSVSRNTGTTNFLASFTNLHEDGVIVGARGYDRKSVRLNLDHSLSEVIDISASGYYSNSERDAPEDTNADVFFGIMFTSPAVSLSERDEKGSLRVKADPLSVEDNPLYILENADISQNRSRVLGNFRGRYKPVDWFDLEANISFDRSDRDESEFYDKGYEQVGSTTYLEGRIQSFAQVVEALNTNVTASFRRTLGALTGRAQFRWATEDFTDNQTSVIGASLAAAGIADLSNVLPGGNKTIGNSSQTIRSEGYYGLVGLDYADKYITDVLVRRDGSSLFGADERWQTYFRASGAYRISEEDFWPLKDQVNEFKLRYSYGTAGARPAFEAQYETFSLSGGQLSKNTLGNSELKPELQTEQEFGVEFGLYDRVFVELVYADSKVEDQLLRIPQPAAVGYSYRWENAGTLVSNTFEASLNASVFRTRNMSLNFGVIFDRTRQEITEFRPPPFLGGTRNFYFREGEVFGHMYGDLFITDLGQLPTGIDQSQFQVNDDGYVVWVGSGNAYTDGISKGLWETSSPAFDTPCGSRTFTWGFPIKFVDEAEGLQYCSNFTKIGSMLPDYNLGFNSTFRWKGFTAYVLWNAQIGGDIYNATAQWGYRDDRHRAQDQAGKPDELKKTANYMQYLYNVNAENSYFVEDGTYLKLRELSVEYSFNRQQLNSVFGNRLHRVAIGVTGRNLLTFTGYSGFDPETGDTGQGNAVGGDASLFRVDNFSYPNFRTFTGRITIEF